MLDETRAKQTMQQAVIFWTIFSLAVMVSVYYNWLMQLFCLVQIILFILWGRYGGFDMYQVDYYNKYFNPRLNNAHPQPDISWFRSKLKGFLGKMAVFCDLLFSACYSYTSSYLSCLL